MVSLSLFFLTEGWEVMCGCGVHDSVQLPAVGDVVFALCSREAEAWSGNPQKAAGASRSWFWLSCCEAN